MPNALETKFGALDRRCPSTAHCVDPAGRCVTHDERACPDHAIASNADPVADGRVYTDEAIFFDDNMAGEDDMGGKKAVVTDDGIVSDVVTAPQDDIVSDPCAGLYDVGFKNEAVISDGNVVINDERPRADVAN